MIYKEKGYGNRVKISLANLGLLFLLQACVSEQIVVYDDLNACDLQVIPSWDQVKSDYNVIGQVSYRDHGLALFCGEKKIMRKIAAKACEANADAVVMHDVVPPMTGGILFGSNCYQASASLLSMAAD